MKNDDGSRAVLVAQGTPKPMDPLCLLYHPHYEPDLTTLRRALLVTETVRSIVPKSANFKPSVRLFKHIDTLPDTFIPTPPKPDDIDIGSDYYALSALKKAFDQLSRDAHVKWPDGFFVPAA